MNEQPPVLLVEDEPHIALGLIYNLQEEGYQVSHVESGEEALKHLEREACALLILDLMLPGIDGLEVCRQIRARDPELPILILTARDADHDRVAGLSEGADDYLTKPFNLKEFLLRVKALLRRSNWQPQTQNSLYRFGANSIDLRNQQAVTSGGKLQLTELEMKMLSLFFANEGEILSRGELLKTVWGMAPDTETRTLDNFVVRIRKYFEPDPAKPVHFLTVRGRGYRFVRSPEEG